MRPANDYAETIRERRRAAGMTQVQLADLIKVTAATVSRWETRGPPPGSRNRRALARELGGSPGDYA